MFVRFCIGVTGKVVKLKPLDWTEALIFDASLKSKLIFAGQQSLAWSKIVYKLLTVCLCDAQLLNLFVRIYQLIVVHVILYRHPLLLF